MFTTQYYEISKFNSCLLNVFRGVFEKKKPFVDTTWIRV